MQYRNGFFVVENCYLFKTRSAYITNTLILLLNDILRQPNSHGICVMSI